MSMTQWAEREVQIACARVHKAELEDPTTRKIQDEMCGFSYDQSCYRSALKAYQGLMKDGHSGCSFNITKNILIRLMNSLPLTPITDEDFPKENAYAYEWQMKKGIVSVIQCPRMCSLFRYEYEDGHVEYHDTDRVTTIDQLGLGWHNGFISDMVDKMFSITMPYYPEADERYRVYVQENNTQSEVGSYDTLAILYIKTPDGQKIEINKYYKDAEIGFDEISKEEWEARVALDKIDYDEI